MEKKFETVAVGGTFDEFHKGHRSLLKKAFEVGNHVLIGLCSDDFVKKLKKPHEIVPYEKRLEELKSFRSINLCYLALFSVSVDFFLRGSVFWGCSG